MYIQNQSKGQPKSALLSNNCYSCGEIMRFPVFLDITERSFIWKNKQTGVCVSKLTLRTLQTKMVLFCVLTQVRRHSGLQTDTFPSLCHQVVGAPTPRNAWWTGCWGRIATTRSSGLPPTGRLRSQWSCRCLWLSSSVWWEVETLQSDVKLSRRRLNYVLRGEGKKEREAWWKGRG